MPQGICGNKDCNRLIYDTEKLEELQDKIECQHCHQVNIIRHRYTCRKCQAGFPNLGELGRHARLEHKKGG